MSKSAKAKPEETVQSNAFIFPNGDQYNGEFVKRADRSVVRQGSGVYTSHTGFKLDGTWVEDKMEGRGKASFKSGARYQGLFVDNKFYGEGVYTLQNGTTIEGKFDNDRISGPVVFTDRNGLRWVGDFDGTKHIETLELELQ